MTDTSVRSLLEAEPPPADLDVPREIDPGIAAADRRFRRIATANGVGVLGLTGAIGVVLAVSLVPTLKHYGFSFFTDSNFLPSEDTVGIAGAMVGTVEIAIMAMLMSFPIALAVSLYISEFAPRWAKGFLVSVMDLMAAVPSLIYGVWGFKALLPQLIFVDRWLAQWLGWIPIFKVPSASPTAVPLDQANFYQSPWEAALVVALMVVPLSSAVMRSVFSQAPVGEREAALALGSTRWGMIRSVVIPFGRGGIIGGTMLGLGRALGETVAVLLILSYSGVVHVRVLEGGGVTISSFIANSFSDASAGTQRDSLLAAGFVLFVMTLVVNTIAAIFVGRSRSGAGVDA